MSDRNGKNNKPKAFPNVREAAEELNYSERKVWREIRDGRLKVHRFGKSTRISRDDLEDYIRRSRG
jgi:excisionase family DNA binding protein